MSYRDEHSPWKSRQQVTKGDLLWKAHDLAMDAIVWCHYTLRRRESNMDRATRDACNDTLRYVKGIAVFWERWLHVKHPRVTVPAEQQPIIESAEHLSAGHAVASPVEHADMRR